MLSHITIEDKEDISSDIAIPWQEMRDCTIMVTGATGAIGSLFIQALSTADVKHKLRLNILAVGRNKERARALFEDYRGVRFIQHDIQESLVISEAVDYIVHGAAITQSKEMVANPVGVIRTALRGTENLLSLAREKKVKSMVYLSSMEVYGITDPALPYVTENDLGYINLQHPRSSYPESKRMCECLSNSYFAQYNLPIKIARLAQTFGAGFPTDDTRIFAQFARSSIAGENIILHTEGRSRGNYCYISDAIRGLLLLLLKGANGETYNIANPDASVTIREMADLVVREVNGGQNSVIIHKTPDVAKRGYAPDVTMRLSADKIASLGWKPKYGLRAMYERLIADWQDDRLVALSKGSGDEAR